MSDLATRLRNWRSVHLAKLHLLMEEAADVVELLDSRLPPLGRLRNGALEGRETVRQGLSQKNHCPDADNAAKRDILTDEEREAVAFFARDNWSMSPVLRGLLERTK
jgi:hypothetical protein